MHPSDKKSENDFSILTDKLVFRGGLGLNLNSTSSNQQTSKDIQNNPKQGYDKDKDNSNSYEPPLHSNGYLSFRSKRDAQGPYENFGQIYIQKSDDTVDPMVITKNIVEKLGALKQKPQKKKNNEDMRYEELSISRIFANQNKQDQEIEKELKNFETDRFEDKIGNMDVDYSSQDESDEEQVQVQKENKKENEENKNCLWSRNNEEEETVECSKERSRSCSEKVMGYKHNDKSSKNSKKEKLLNNITCTLSRIEKGKAIFVSNDDLIFVLPALFVPSNLMIGNTYLFRISEYDKFQTKFLNIHAIQKKYAHPISIAKLGSSPSKK